MPTTMTAVSRTTDSRQPAHHGDGRRGRQPSPSGRAAGSSRCYRVFAAAPDQQCRRRRRPHRAQESSDRKCRRSPDNVHADLARDAVELAPLRQLLVGDAPYRQEASSVMQKPLKRSSSRKSSGNSRGSANQFAPRSRRGRPAGCVSGRRTSRSASRSRASRGTAPTS